MTEVLIVILIIAGLLVLATRLITDGTMKLACQIILVLILAVYLLREFGPGLVG